MTYEALDKDGKPIAGRIVPDGGRVRVATMLMDAAPPAGLHQPGSATLTDADRDARAASYADRKRRLSDAWRTPAPAEPVAGAKSTPTTPAAAVATPSDTDARYAARCAGLEQAWRS